MFAGHHEVIPKDEQKGPLKLISLGSGRLADVVLKKVDQIQKEKEEQRKQDMGDVVLQKMDEVQKEKPKPISKQVSFPVDMDMCWS